MAILEVDEVWIDFSLRKVTLWEIDEKKSFDGSSQAGGSQQETVDGCEEMLLMVTLAVKLCAQVEQLVEEGDTGIGEQEVFSNLGTSLLLFGRMWF